MSASSVGGYTVRDLDKLDPKYHCQICNRLLKEPAQLPCGERICSSCVPTQSESFSCKVCRFVSDPSQVRLDKGFKRDMELLSISCAFCLWTGKLQFYQNHLETDHQQRRCSHCDMIFDSSAAFHEHEENQCLKKPVDCPFLLYGCNNQIPRGELGQHYLSERHQAVLMACLQKVMVAGEAYTTQSNSMETDVTACSTQGSTKSSSMTDLAEQPEDIQQLMEAIDLLAKGTQQLTSEISRLATDAKQTSESMERIERTLKLVKDSSGYIQSLLHAMHLNATLIEQKVSSLKTRFEEQPMTSYDGTLVWRITQFRSKMMDARSERQTSIYSPVFCSSPTGYRMKARLYLYGDGNARRTHMSLFFVLVRGPHDAILSFPINAKVTFCLFDQTPAKKHIIESFRPDPKSNSFQRPRSDMNIASGIPKFAALSIFEDPNCPYVENDTVFIRVIVDFENMTKQTLAFATKLNPGLPNSVRQKLLERESARLAQQQLVEAQAAVMPTAEAKPNADQR